MTLVKRLFRHDGVVFKRVKLFLRCKLHHGDCNPHQDKLDLLHTDKRFCRNFHTSQHFSMAKRLFEDKDHAQSYAKFRPTYPVEVFESLVEFYRDGKGETCNFDLAVDVACGNGQSTRPLCKYFRRVIGCDVSPEQISSAMKDNVENLSFLVNKGEDLSFLENNSVDLLTISQALHWLDRQTFYNEVSRVLKPGGVFAATGYGVNKLRNEKGNDVMWQFYHDLLGSYWDEKRFDLESHYEEYDFPFPGWQRKESPNLVIKRLLSIEDYVGYLTTFSAWRKYDRENPNSGQIEKVKESFKEVYGDSGEPVIEVMWPIFMLIGRKPI